jgi:hypothetical protein
MNLELIILSQSRETACPQQTNIRRDRNQIGGGLGRAAEAFGIEGCGFLHGAMKVF